jgi:hypothetical protein
MVKVVKQLRYMETSPTETGESIYARVNHGRWLADCPVCRGAELVTEGEPFLCGSCGALGKVTWPKDTTKIETLLEVRPRDNQNWDFEPVKVLDAENKERGL